ncbi:hypothetical protein ACF1HJ_09315 [Streptomyces sp. NPDC013978]|uniref:hypothetical protein n=1 Tax=Streptomyces sp. NPDC013978 TaxID=3364869 RepID=UPI0036F9F417
MAGFITALDDLIVTPAGRVHRPDQRSPLITPSRAHYRPTRASFDLAHRLSNASLRIYPDAGHDGVFQHHDHHEQFVPHVPELLR